MSKGTARANIVKTRKPHICDSCSLEIPTGSVTMNANGIGFDEEGTAHPYSHHFCQSCMDEPKEAETL